MGNAIKVLCGYFKDCYKGGIIMAISVLESYYKGFVNTAIMVPEGCDKKCYWGVIKNVKPLQGCYKAITQVL